MNIDKLFLPFLIAVSDREREKKKLPFFKGFDTNTMSQ